MNPQKPLVYKGAKQPIMQKTIVFFCLFICSQVLIALTPPENILPLSQTIYSVTYYEEQQLVWEEHIATHSNDANAWLNYYTAARNVNILKGETVNDLNRIADDIQRETPATFEAHYVRYKQSDLFNRNYAALIKAYELAPDKWAIYSELLHYYEITNNQLALATYAKRLFESGQLSSGILDWNYNALMSVSKNAILLTHSDNDTSPAWILQQVRNVRKDVNVLNLYLLLAEDSYRERVFNQLNISVQYSRPLNQSIDLQLKSLIHHLFQYCDRPLFIGVGTPSSLRDKLQSDLYLTGLAFQHSDREIDNLAIMDHNYQKQFRLEALRTPLAYDPSESVVNHMNLNYLPSFALLYNYYLNNNRPIEAENTKTLITNIATRASKQNQLSLIFGQEEFDSKDFTTAINLREIDKQLKPVQPQLYASSYEVSNGEYDAFLKDLLNQRKFETLGKCQIYPTDWRSHLDEKFKDISDLSLYNQAHPDADSSPIVNISHEAAVLYCEWLTTVYNQSDHRKKRFKEVKFRLPTKEEWTLAARGGFEQSPYPWGGPYYKNAKGCLLANFDPSQEVKTTADEEQLGSEQYYANEDGGFFTVNVDAYFPNNFGFHNMSGNAAEMTYKDGITVGGGWQDASYYMQIGVEKKEAIPSPNVGFRVFMDVIK